MKRLVTVCLSTSPLLLVGCLGLVSNVPPQISPDASEDASPTSNDATAPDGGHDATVPDATTDGATVDSGDASLDAFAPDATAEAGVEAGADAAHEAGSEGGVEADAQAGPDAAAEAGVEAGVDAGIDAAHDATVDATLDAGNDAAQEAGQACMNLAVDASGVPVSGANPTGGQNVPAGTTPDGHTILVQHGGCSSGLSLNIADWNPDGGPYTLLAVPTLTGADVTFEENVTLEADGLTIISLNTAHTGFVTSARTAVGLANFSTPTVGPFTNIVATGTQKFWGPSISADGLAFYYTVQSDPATNGIYESVRASTSVPFPLGTLMPSLIQGLAQYVNGVSVDRLAIYLEESSTYAAVMLTRTSTSLPFSNPLAPAAPPAVPGLRSRPLATCGQYFGTCSLSAGCTNEEACLFGVP